MWRFGSLLLAVASCCALHGVDAAEVVGNDQMRAMFRTLTSEQSETPALTTPPEQSPTASTAEATEIAQPTVNLPPTTAPAVLSPVPQSLVQATPAIHAPRPAVFYGGNSARQTLSQFPRRAAIQTNAQRSMRRQQKPFEGVEHEPTLSPYLNLDQDEDDVDNVPNYFTLVRPRIEQLETNRVQQREIQQLRGQIQSMTASAGAVSPYDAGGSVGMHTPARFMDTAQFYGRAR